MIGNVPKINRIILNISFLKLFNNLSDYNFNINININNVFFVYLTFLTMGL